MSRVDLLQVDSKVLFTHTTSDRLKKRTLALEFQFMFTMSAYHAGLKRSAKGLYKNARIAPIVIGVVKKETKLWNSVLFGVSIEWDPNISGW